VTVPRAGTSPGICTRLRGGAGWLRSPGSMRVGLGGPSSSSRSRAVASRGHGINAEWRKYSCGHAALTASFPKKGWVLWTSGNCQLILLKPRAGRQPSSLRAPVQGWAHGKPASFFPPILLYSPQQSLDWCNPCKTPATTGPAPLELPERKENAGWMELGAGRSSDPWPLSPPPRSSSCTSSSA